MLTGLGMTLYAWALKARRINSALASAVTDEELDAGLLFPSISRLRSVAQTVARAVMTTSGAGSYSDAEADQAARGNQRIFAQLAERIGPDQRAAWIVEIKTTFALRGIIQRFGKCGKIRIAAWMAVCVGGGDEGRLGRRHQGRGVGHML